VHAKSGGYRGVNRVRGLSDGVSHFCSIFPGFLKATSRPPQGSPSASVSGALQGQPYAFLQPPTLPLNALEAHQARGVATLSLRAV
jgi:hypothetical protein